MSDQAEEFLSALYANQTGRIELRAFDHPEANRLRNFVQVKQGKFDFSPVDQFLKETERRQLGAFFGVALRTEAAAKERKGDAAHCQTLTALFVDADYKHLGEEVTHRRIAEFPITPSAIVRSGGGMHPYWFLETPVFLQAAGGTHQAKQHLQAIASAVGDVVDQSVSEPARVLRIPGSYNFKKHYPEPQPVLLAEFSGDRYPCSTFEPYLGVQLAAESNALPFNVPDEIDKGARHEVIYKLHRSQKARGVSLEASLAACHVENEQKCKPPIPRAELDSYLRRVWDQPDSPDFQSPTPSNGTVILVSAGEKKRIVDDAERALLVSGGIYQRGGFLTRIVRHAPVGTDDIRREANATVLSRVQEHWLLEQMGKAAEWRKPVAKGAPTLADPPAIYAKTLLERQEWQFPTIRAIVKAPTLTADGRLLQQRGFDEPSGLYLDIPANYFPPVSERPTIDDALAAMQVLQHPIRGFPFVGDAAKSVALAAILTAVIRGSLQTSPLHAFDAPTAGTGKSLLAELAGLVATGTRPPAMSQGKTEEEDEKRMSTVLFAGDPVIHLDNCERPISGDFLCSMLTQTLVQARILGKSERRILPSTALVLASGNNLTLAGDVSRRAVICRLDAGMERPDHRSFDFDCHAEALATRPQLVHAALTLLRAYDIAGRPVKLTPMGSFTDWEWVRGALVWVGMDDPADTREAIFESDPRKDELLSVMDLWQSEFGDEWTDVAAIGVRRDSEPHYSELCIRLTDVACKGGKWSGKSVGWWLKRNKDRVVSSRAFECEPGGHSKRWRLSGPQGLLETE